MKTVTDGISKILEEKIKEVDKVYDPACQKLSVQAEAISDYLQKVEKSLNRTNEVLENSKLQELITAQKTIYDDIRMLTNARPSNLTTFQVHVQNSESCKKKLCFHRMFTELVELDVEGSNKLFCFFLWFMAIDYLDYLGFLA